jgi:hypothetical protein
VLLGAFVGLVALWASWVAWIHRLFANSDHDLPLVELATSPLMLLDLMRAINMVGVWRFSGNTYRGGLLTAVWVAEALILVLGCTFVASLVGKPGLFCPACRKRCARVPGSLGRYDGSDTTEVRDRLAAGDFDYLLALGRVRDEDDPEIGLEVLACPCGQTNVLNASRIAWEATGEGGMTVKVRPLVEGLLLAPEQVGHVRGLKDRLPPADGPAEGEPSDSDEDESEVPADEDDGNHDGDDDRPHDPYADRRPAR